MGKFGVQEGRRTDGGEVCQNNRNVSGEDIFQKRGAYRRIYKWRVKHASL